MSLTQLTQSMMLRDMAKKEQKCPRCDSKQYTFVRKGEFIARECTGCHNVWRERTPEAAVKELKSKKRGQLANSLILGVMFIVFGIVFILWGLQMLTWDPAWFLDLAYTTIITGLIFLVPGIIFIPLGQRWVKKTKAELQAVQAAIASKGPR